MMIKLGKGLWVSTGVKMEYGKLIVVRFGRRGLLITKLDQWCGGESLTGQRGKMEKSPLNKPSPKALRKRHISTQKSN